MSGSLSTATSITPFFMAGIENSAKNNHL
jgi:hypothetical protein